MKPRFLTALPVYNEESHVAAVLDEVRRHAQDILVVNDGSSDRTAEVLAPYTDVHIITHETNLGYGAALRSALAHALDEEYDVLVTIDCDGQHQPRLIPELVAAVFSAVGPDGPTGPFARTVSVPRESAPVREAGPTDEGPPWDIVSGSRYLRQFEGDTAPPADRRRINRTITEELNARLGLELTDAFCGFKAYRVEALRHFHITETGYAMPLQVWVQAAAARLRIVEYPVPLIYLEEERSFGGSLDDARRRLAYYRKVLARELAAVGHA